MYIRRMNNTTQTQDRVLAACYVARKALDASIAEGRPSGMLLFQVDSAWSNAHAHGVTVMADGFVRVRTGR